MTLELISALILAFTSFNRNAFISRLMSLLGLGLFIYAVRFSDAGVLNLILSAGAVSAFWYSQSMRVTLSSARTLIVLLLSLGFAVFLFQDTLPFLGNQGMTGIWKAFDIKPGQIASLKSSHETALSLYFDHEPSGDERYFKTGVLNVTSDGLEYHMGPRQGLPTGMYPRTSEFVMASLSGLSLDQDLEFISKWWTHDFRYTLDPGVMTGEFPLDTFLFKRKLGFCEHYAAALTTLLKLKNYDARVVLGLAGGTWNPMFRKLTYEMADAHAWVEVYESGTKHWRRLDPTLWINPTENQPRSSRALLTWTFGILSLALFLVWIFSGRIKDPLVALLIELSRLEKKTEGKERSELTVAERLDLLSERNPGLTPLIREIKNLYQDAYFNPNSAIKARTELFRKVRFIQFNRIFSSFRWR